jgi:hypothetical protein
MPLSTLKKAVKKTHLQINGKAKHMPVTKKACTDVHSHAEIGSYKSEILLGSKYTGSEVICKNDISAEIQKSILSASRYFQGLRKHLKSHLI